MSALPSRFADDLLVEYLCDDAGYFLRGGRLLEAGRSQWQAYEVWDTPLFGRLFRLDGCLMSSERDEFYYQDPPRRPTRCTACRQRSTDRDDPDHPG